MVFELATKTTKRIPSKPPPPNSMSFDLPLKATPEQQKERFVQSLSQALMANKYSRREHCEALGITIGTLTKYLRGAVDPSKVGVAIMRNLAKELGLTTNALMDYFESGEYRSSLSIDDVASWIRSEAGQQDLPALLMALQENAASAVSTIQPSTELKKPEKPAWPGYTDLEAEAWCTNIHDCLKHLAAKQGKSLRGVWPSVEAELIRLELTSDEIDFAWELAVAGDVVTGEQLTEARGHFEGRFEEPCPLMIALKKRSWNRSTRSLRSCEMTKKKTSVMLALVSIKRKRFR